MELYILDTILYVSKHPLSFKNKDEIISKVKSLSEGKSFSDEIFTLAFEKLENDGYIKKEGEVYGITMDGLLFEKTSGYESQMKESGIDGNRQYAEHVLEKRIYHLTCWVAIGTSVAGLYYIIEIGKWINHILQPYL